MGFDVEINIGSSTISDFKSWKAKHMNFAPAETTKATDERKTL